MDYFSIFTLFLRQTRLTTYQKKQKRSYFCSQENKYKKLALTMVSLKNVYLVTYNVAMFGGWGYIFYNMVNHLLEDGNPKEAIKTLYPVVQGALVVFQTGAIAEIAHAALGLVRSSAFNTFFQVASRLFVLYGALEIGPTVSRQKLALVMMLTAWCLSEMIRYSFYACNLMMNKAPSFLTWLRYSAFMILYPVGITGEVVTLYRALPYIRSSGRWTIELPNTMNISFDWVYTIWFVLLVVYPPASKLLYTYMLRQRRKTLGKKKVQ